MADIVDMRSLENHVVAGRYRLDRYLSEGNFGAVYQASHVAFELELREVAIKVAKHPMDDREAREVFSDALKMVRLAEAAGQDPIARHFVTIHDVGRCAGDGPLAGHSYMVMELIRDGSIQSCLSVGPFPLARASSYFTQMLAAVGFMHKGVKKADGGRESIIHRDIKPGNVLVVRNADAPDVVKIADFGLAVEVDRLLGWARSGGDLAYLAPESFSHDICSRKTDVYMLALVFYEMVTGQSPFGHVGLHLKGDDAAKRKELRRLHLKARHCERFALLERHPELARKPELIRVIQAALTVDMNSRPYEDADEFLAAWREAAGGGASPAQEEPWETVRRLTGEAELFLAVEDNRQWKELLDQAMSLNVDRGKVPDHKLVGRTYLLMVKELINCGQSPQAIKLASEGYHRRRCRSTCEAMAWCYKATNAMMAQGFRQEAQTCDDPE